MNTIKLLTILLVGLSFTACVSKKKFAAMETDLSSQLSAANKQIGVCGKDLNKCMSDLSTASQERDKLQALLTLREEQIADYKAQLERQVSQVGNLTVLSQSANDNIKETLSQLENKDKYIQLLQAAKTKADSINLALAVNLKSVLKDGLDDEDVEVKVDKTVVFINLSDKMLFQSGSATLTPRAKEVLGKIAQIVESRPEVEVMVEGYTDNVPIKNNCMVDNWDLSVKRSTSVVRVLQSDYAIDPNRLIAAGRGEYNTLTTNTTPEGRAINRRTRIIIMPKLDQFYDLLNPNTVPK